MTIKTQFEVNLPLHAQSLNHKFVGYMWGFPIYFIRILEPEKEPNRPFDSTHLLYKWENWGQEKSVDGMTCTVKGKE